MTAQGLVPLPEELPAPDEEDDPELDPDEEDDPELDPDEEDDPELDEEPELELDLPPDELDEPEELDPGRGPPELDDPEELDPGGGAPELDELEAPELEVEPVELEPDDPELEAGGTPPELAEPDPELELSPDPSGGSPRPTVSLEAEHPAATSSAPSAPTVFIRMTRSTSVLEHSEAERPGDGSSNTSSRPTAHDSRPSQVS